VRFWWADSDSTSGIGLGQDSLLAFGSMVDGAYDLYGWPHEQTVTGNFSGSYDYFIIIGPNITENISTIGSMPSGAYTQVIYPAPDSVENLTATGTTYGNYIQVIIPAPDQTDNLTATGSMPTGNYFLAIISAPDHSESLTATGTMSGHYDLA
jgi:hypothetical protein